MKATSNGRTFYASFKHTTKKGYKLNKRHTGPKTYEETTCTIRTEDAAGVLQQVASGTCRRSFQDPENRIVGNLTALKKAIVELNDRWYSLYATTIYNQFAAQMRKIPNEFMVGLSEFPPR